MDSPLEKFIEWYMSLPVPHRQSIVEFVIFFNLGFDDIDTTNTRGLHNAFVKKLSKYSQDKLKGTGLALMFRGNVDFVIRKWGTREGCKESEKFLSGVKEHFSATGEEFMADRARKLLILIVGSFIIGLDIDEPGIGKLIAEVARRYGVDNVNVLFLTPLPGTRLWGHMKAEGHIALDTFPENWKYYPNIA
jgi:hypothetical protein